MTTVAARVNSVLRAAGRDVELQQTERELDELEGLKPEAAEAVLLSTYGLDPAGQPSPGFVSERGSAAALWATLRPGRPALTFIIVAALAGIVPALAVPLLIQAFVNEYLVNGDIQWQATVIVGVIGAALIAFLLRALQVRVAARLARRLLGEGQMAFTWHILRMRVPDLADAGPGAIAARALAVNRTGLLAGFLVPLSAVGAINVVVFAIAMLLLDFTMGLVGVGVAAVSMLTSVAVLRWRGKIKELATAESASLYDLSAEIIGGIDSVKAPAWEGLAFKEWAVQRRRLGIAASRLGIATQWTGLIPILALGVGLGLSLAVGSYEVAAGTLSVGKLVASQAFLALLLGGLSSLVWTGALLQNTTSSIALSHESLSRPLDPETVSEGAEPDDGERLVGEVRAVGLRFGFDRERSPLIDGLDLLFPAGSRVALVGSTGSGKTTISRLLIGELRPWSGVVELDRIPRLAVARAKRSRSLAYVPQSPILFPGTVRDNLSMWDPAITDDQIRRAAQDACIDETILARAGGFNAEVLGRDGGFSGGELQRLAIARALARNPSVLVLDEATSALDPILEARIEERIRARGCSAIVIAHRLSTVRDADQILVVDKGRIVQRGNFEEISGEGAFAELVHA